MDITFFTRALSMNIALFLKVSDIWELKTAYQSMPKHQYKSKVKMFSKRRGYPGTRISHLTITFRL